MSKIKSIIDEVAKTDITVLIKGESGSGKELIAQIIHQESHRSQKPYLKVNCAAIPANLLESELFGFEKGAFTGAHLMKPGKFEMANGGTILLNDIEEMSLSLQAKLLQVLQDGAFTRLGGNGNITADVRIIVTTKNHLERKMVEGRFREDLFFRINVINLTIPPLRDRIEQIVPLSQYFFTLFKKKYGREVSSLSSTLLDAFRTYHWPGNIRELENFIKQVVILGKEDMVLQALYEKREDEKNGKEPWESLSCNPANPKWLFDLKEVGRKAAEKAEKDMIGTVLLETHWNRREAANLLRISYKALLYKIQKYGLDRARVNRNDQAKSDRNSEAMES